MIVHERLLPEERRSVAARRYGSMAELTDDLAAAFAALPIAAVTVAVVSLLAVALLVTAPGDPTGARNRSWFAGNGGSGGY